MVTECSAITDSQRAVHCGDRSKDNCAVEATAADVSEELFVTSEVVLFAHNMVLEFVRDMAATNNINRHS